MINVYHIKVISKALDDYDLEQIFLSFNGGKDCTVLLHLVYSLLKRRPNTPHSALLCVYLQPEHPFDEVESFVADCSIKYFPIVIKPGLGTKQDALFRICNEYPALRACLMGCRRTDPYCQELNDFEVRTEIGNKFRCCFIKLWKICWWKKTVFIWRTMWKNVFDFVKHFQIIRLCLRFAIIR